jgi:hypothetical protein
MHAATLLSVERRCPVAGYLSEAHARQMCSTCEQVCQNQQGHQSQRKRFTVHMARATKAAGTKVLA